MRKAKTFDTSILNNPDNNFSLKIIYGDKCKVELFIPQFKVVSTLQQYVDSNPTQITIYWSSASVYKTIVDALLADQSINVFQKLSQLEKRIPYLYYYKIKKTL